MEDYEEKLIKKYKDNNDDKLPPTLYHYTSQGGLLKILKWSEIWATDILYLNDHAEFTHSVDLMKGKIRKIGKSLSNERVKKSFKALLDPSRFLDDFQFFVCSFSTDGNLLSLWRSYCPDNNGFSIGFDYIQLRNIVKSQNFTAYLLPCFYDEKMFDEFTMEVLSGFIDYLKTNIDEDLEKIIDEYERSFLLLASILKHQSFRDEKEWRLFCFKKRSVISSEIQFRRGKSMLLPYITVDLRGKTQFPPIKQIYVGPTPHKDLSVNSVKLLVQSKHLSCSVEYSDIPYRSW